MKHLAAHDLDFASLLQPGDRIVVGQATAEPRTLTRRLVTTRNLPTGCSVFLGPVYSDTFDGSPDSLAFESYGAIGRASALAATGRLAVLPWHYSAFTSAFADGELRADCVLVQVPPGEAEGRYNLGLANDHLVLAARHARLVIAEVNEHAPRCQGGEWPGDVPIHIAVPAEEAPIELPAAALDATSVAIAGHVATLIPNRAVLQFGVGTLPQAVAAGLTKHRDLGIHSGALIDGVIDLVEKGAVTNAAKEIDPGVSVAGLLLGTRKLYDFVHDNPAFRLCGPAHTHDLGVISRLSRFCAVNSAVEVDLTGQVNAETANGRYVGAVGGQVDFVRGANASPGGRAIIALPSTARSGTVSRIVPRVETITCARSDADAIVTEWGVAELRGCTLPERARRMIAIAAPEFREELERAWFEAGRRSDG